MKYVKGEIEATIFPQKGILSRGMNMPLMKTNGNLTRVESIMMLDGAFVGGVDNSRPNEEKQAPAKIIPNINI